MNRILSMLIAVGFVAASPLYADYSVETRGAWPTTWPKELESLRKQARTLEGPLAPLLHYAIPFTTREEFEAAWPHLVTLKTQGAPVVLRRGPSFWLGDTANPKAGVCVHCPPAGDEAQSVPATPLAGGQNTRWETTTYIELIVDGEIVDLNRIQLPADTPIIDERFKNDTTK